MANIYGIYKKARDASWQALIDNKVDSLPVDLAQIVDNNGINLLKNSQVHELRSKEVGISLFDGKRWFIVYDDSLPLGRKRFTIAHELGHIFLGHPLVAGFHARTTDENLPQTETAANVFASRFLAPACVLWGLNAHTADEIARFCEISAEAAGIRAKRMAELYKRNMFLTSPLEQQVYNQFKDFIEQNRLVMDN
ncbi:MAG: ImmA/IrrE family metallo-endopeptidase [Oscillospiraceae bacterium]|nr:ImmA/IrrE family metallo-endopeptidase [Oscillospiraceae bacterium]